MEKDLPAVIKEATEIPINHANIRAPIPEGFASGTLKIVPVAENGGIDLDRFKMQMNVSKNGHGIQMPFDSTIIAQIKAQGFEGLDFQLQSIVLINNLRALLNLDTE